MAAAAQFEASCRAFRPLATPQFTSCLRQDALARSAWPSPAMQMRRPFQERATLAGFAVSAGRFLSTTTARHARLIPRPKRPYQFTQLVQLSDGSTFITRTTNPHALLKCSKDSRNNALWQPSDKSLKNIEVDEAGKLAAFRNRFGRGWDAESTRDGENAGVGDGVKGSNAAAGKENPDALDALTDLLSGYAAKSPVQIKGGRTAKEPQWPKKKA